MGLVNIRVISFLQNVERMSVRGTLTMILHICSNGVCVWANIEWKDVHDGIHRHIPRGQWNHPTCYKVMHSAFAPSASHPSTYDKALPILPRYHECLQL
jgi:hypothetical protein